MLSHRRPCGHFVEPFSFGPTIRTLLQLTKKTSKNEGLEYRAAFNLLLQVIFLQMYPTFPTKSHFSQVVFGDSLKAWSHCSNWFFLHAWILRVSSAVEIDPVLEAQLGDNALLRKSSGAQQIVSAQPPPLTRRAHIRPAERSVAIA